MRLEHYHEDKTEQGQAFDRLAEVLEETYQKDKEQEAMRRSAEMHTITRNGVKELIW